MQYYAILDQDLFWHIGSKRYVKLCFTGRGRICPVTIREDLDGPYWGWQDTGEEEYTMIWPRRQLFEMCFTYGPAAEQKRGKGRVVRLVIEEKVGEDGLF